MTEKFSPSKSITGAALLLGIATLLSRIVALFRDRTFAHFFGASPTLDAYYAAFKVPDLIYSLLIAGALTAGFIPTFTRLFFESEDKSKAWRLASNVVTIVAVALVILGGLGMIFTPFLVKVIAPGFAGDRQALVIQFTRIMLISPFLLGISMVIGGILQSLRQFLLYSIAPIFYNLGIIFGTVFFVPWFGVTGLAWGVVLGALLHLSVQVIGAYQNHYRWHWHFDLKDANTRLIGKLMIPRTIGLAVNQLNTVIIIILASFLKVGSVTIFTFANNLQDVPTGIIGISFALAVFPVLSRLSANNNMEEFGERVSSTARQILFLIIPLSVAMLLLRVQIVRLVYGSGAFDWPATINTANTLAFFALGLFAQSLIPLFARAFYSLNNTITPFVISVIAELLCIIFSLLLMRSLGVPGLALADAGAAVFNAILLMILLRKKIRSAVDEKILSLLLKLGIASLIMGIVVQLSKEPLSKIFDQQYFLGVLGLGLMSGVLGLLVYGIICRFLKVEEMLHLQASLQTRWLRLWNIGEGVDQAEKL